MNNPTDDINGPTGSWAFIGLERIDTGSCTNDGCNAKFSWSDGSSFDYNSYDGYFPNGMNVDWVYDYPVIEANGNSINGATNVGQYAAICTAPCGVTPAPRTICYESFDFKNSAVSVFTGGNPKEECEKLNQQRPSIKNVEEFLDLRRWWLMENDGKIMVIC